MYTLVYHPKMSIGKNIIKLFKLQISLIKKVQRNTKADLVQRRLWYCRMGALKKFLTYFSEMSGVSLKFEECKTQYLFMLIKDLLIFYMNMKILLKSNEQNF